MSLINDALKRAQEVQESHPPGATPGPELRPVEPAKATLRGAGLLLPAVLAVIALLVLFMAWQAVQQPGDSKPDPDPSKLEVRAKGRLPEPSRILTPAVKSPAAGLPARPTAPLTRTRPRPPALQTATEPEPAVRANENAVSNPVVVPLAVQGTTTEAARQSSVEASNTPPAALVAPKPPAFKLQSIVLDPSRPSAMINSRIVFLGDAIEEFRVSKITAATVTLTAPGRQKVLVLGQ
jgi:hypothetical protein